MGAALFFVLSPKALLRLKLPRPILSAGHSRREVKQGMEKQQGRGLSWPGHQPHRSALSSSSVPAVLP